MKSIRTASSSPSRIPARLVATLAIALASAGAARAADFYWDADGATTATVGGTGNWDTSSSLWRSGNSTGTLGAWSNTGINNDAFLQGTSGNLTLTTGISVNDITVNPSPAGVYTIAGSSQILTLGGATQSVLDVASGSTLAITSGLNGVNGLTKSSAGTLILDGAGGTNGLVGAITVSGGTLQAGSATNLSSSQALRSNFVNLASGTSLTTVGNATIFDLRVGALSGSGLVTPATGGAVNILALSDSTFSGAITTTGGLNLRGSNGSTQTFNGNLTGLTGTIGVNSGATVRLTGTGDSTSGVSGVTTIATRGGSFVMDNTAGNTSAAAGRVSNSTPVTMLGGTLSLIGNSAATSETIGTIALNAGAATISVTHNGGAGGTVLTFADGGAIRDSTSMTANFVGNGGTLGTAGANPRIIFSSSSLFTGTGGLLANSSGGVTVGWATVNGSEWAGYNATNGVVAVSPTLTTATNTGLQGATSSSVTVFNPSANQSLSATVTTGTLKLAPTTSGLTLAMGSNTLATNAIMLAGTTDFSMTGGAPTGSASRYIHVVEAGTTLNYSGSLALTNGSPINKGGEGFLVLNGASSQVSVASSTSNLNIVSGVLRGTTTTLGGSASTGGASMAINLRGGVLEISGGGSFSRAIDLATVAGSGGVITFDGGGTNRGDGGFSAHNGNATVNLVTTLGGSTAATLRWDDGAFLSNGYALTMGSTKADSRIDLTNNISLDDTSVSGGAANSYFAREVRVADNTGSTTDVARLSGVISGSANADLLKTGAGVLELTNANTYAGNTLVNQGTLLVNNTTGSGTGTGKVLVASGATLGGTGTITGATYVNGGSLTGTLNLASLVATGSSSIASSVNISSGTTISSGAFTLTGTLNSAVTIASGAILQGTGTVTGATTIQSGGFLSPGNSPGIQNFANDLTLSGTTVMEINGTARGTGYDGINMTGTSANTLTYGGTLSMSFNAPITAAVYNLFAIGSVAEGGDFGTVTIGGTAVVATTGTITGSGWTATVIDTQSTPATWSLSFNNATGDLTIAPIPEPSAYAALAGVGMIGFALYRRRRQNAAKRAA